MFDDIRPTKKYEQSYAKIDRSQEEEVDPPEPRFQPPDSLVDDEIVMETPKPNKPKKKGKGNRVRLPAWFQKLSRKQQLIIGAISLLVIGGVVSAVVFRHKPTPAPAPIVKQEPAPEPPPPPTTTPSRLTGVEVPIELDKVPVTGVMIENSPDARPQSGLKDAGVVFEAIAEGGITRFLALFQTDQPDYIGPVRSARPYYLDFLVPFDAPLAHAGGSGQALAEISQQGIKDLEYGVNSGAYHRVNSRYAPHNLYTSRAELLDLQRAKGWGTSEFTGFVRKAEQPAATPTKTSIDFKLSGYLYDPHFEYDPVAHNYKRFEAGQPHVNEKGGGQITPKVVIAVVMPHHYEGIYSVYGTIGSGKAYVFQDGTVTEGIWEKADRKSQIKFGDANGAPLGLNPGQTWITLVSAYTDVISTP